MAYDKDEANSILGIIKAHEADEDKNTPDGKKKKLKASTIFQEYVKTGNSMFKKLAGKHLRGESIFDHPAIQEMQGTDKAKE